MLAIVLGDEKIKMRVAAVVSILMELIIGYL